MRLDGDQYGSTIVALESLYPKLSNGGFVIIDDYIVDACRTAGHDYRKANGIRDEIIQIDQMGVYWPSPNRLTGGEHAVLTWAKTLHHSMIAHIEC